MLDCVQCSSIVFNIHYVHLRYFHFDYHYVQFVHIFTALFYIVFLVARVDDD